MKAKDIYQKLRSFGWQFYRKGKGSHQIWKRGNRCVTVAVRTMDADARSLKNFLAQIK